MWIRINRQYCKLCDYKELLDCKSAESQNCHCQEIIAKAILTKQSNHHVYQNIWVTATSRLPRRFCFAKTPRNNRPVFPCYAITPTMDRVVTPLAANFYFLNKFNPSKIKISIGSLI